MATLYAAHHLAVSRNNSVHVNQFLAWSKAIAFCSQFWRYCSEREILYSSWFQKCSIPVSYTSKSLGLPNFPIIAKIWSHLGEGWEGPASAHFTWALSPLTHTFGKCKEIQSNANRMCAQIKCVYIWMIEEKCLPPSWCEMLWKGKKYWNKMSY